jgi:phosphocarrier protein
MRVAQSPLGDFRAGHPDGTNAGRSRSMKGRSRRVPPLIPDKGLSSMQIRLVELTNRLGLHARACAKVVRVASRFRSEICLIWNGRRASARSMMAVMLLAAGVGATIRLEASGPDETEAMTAMVQLISGRFGEVQ